MIGNSRGAGIATERPQRDRELANLACNGADQAMRWAIDACVPGEYSETLLPELLWALDKAAACLTPLEQRHQQADRKTHRGVRLEAVCVP